LELTEVLSPLALPLLVAASRSTSIGFSSSLVSPTDAILERQNKYSRQNEY
jgi:hypothetical protein